MHLKAVAFLCGTDHSLPRVHPGVGRFPSAPRHQPHCAWFWRLLSSRRCFFVVEKVSVLILMGEAGSSKGFPVLHLFSSVESPCLDSGTFVPVEGDRRVCLVKGGCAPCRSRRALGKSSLRLLKAVGTVLHHVWVDLLQAPGRPSTSRCLTHTLSSKHTARLPCTPHTPAPCHLRSPSPLANVTLRYELRTSTEPSEARWFSDSNSTPRAMCPVCVHTCMPTRVFMHKCGGVVAFPQNWGQSH